MSNIAVWFDIPVKDMARAKRFYTNVMHFSFDDMDMEGMKMSAISAAETDVSGMLVEAEDYEPSATGQVVYFSGGEDLSEPLARAVEQGAEIIVPRTDIGEGKGFFAMFLDSEGNRIGLYSVT